MTKKSRPNTIAGCYVEIARLEELLNQSIQQGRQFAADNARLHRQINLQSDADALAVLIQRIARRES